MRSLQVPALAGVAQQTSRSTCLQVRTTRKRNPRSSRHVATAHALRRQAVRAESNTSGGELQQRKRSGLGRRRDKSSEEVITDYPAAEQRQQYQRLQRRHQLARAATTAIRSRRSSICLLFFRKSLGLGAGRSNEIVAGRDTLFLRALSSGFGYVPSQGQIRTTPSQKHRNLPSRPAL